MKFVLVGLLCFILSSDNYAQTGPYKFSQTDANIAQRFFHIVDNSTVGVAQTVLGSAHVLVYLVMNPIRGERLPKYEIHKNGTGEVRQLVINEIPVGNADAYSLGLIQIGGDYQDHEGGHSVASATLGPLYLPTVGISYLFESYHNSFIETWADLEADPSQYMNTASGQVGIGSTVVNGVVKDVIVYKFNIEQRQVMDDDTIASDKIYQWINTKIIHPRVKDLSPDQMPTLIEFDLLKKTLNIVIDNISIYLNGDQQIRTSIKTEQRYLHIESNPALKKMHIKALDWKANYGIEYNLANKLHVSPRVGVGMSADAFSNGSKDYYNLQFKDKYTWTGSMNLAGSLEIKIFDYLTVKGQYQKEWYFNKNKTKTFSLQVGNTFRNPNAKFKAFQYVEVSGGYKAVDFRMPDQTLRWSEWNGTLGFRF